MDNRNLLNQKIQASLDIHSGWLNKRIIGNKIVDQEYINFVMKEHTHSVILFVKEYLKTKSIEL